MDDDNSKSLNKYEFSKAMNDFMLGFNQSEVSILFDYFDMSNDGQIGYDEFLRAVRGPMNASRLALVHQAFGKMDKDGNGYIDYTDLKGVYSG